MHAPVRLSSPLMRYAAMALDALLVWACALGAYVWHIRPGELLVSLPPQYFLIVLVASLIFLLLSDYVYRSWRLHPLRDMLQSVLVGWLVVGLMIVVWLFLAKMSADISRVWFVTWVAGSLVAQCLLRLLVYLVLHQLRRTGYNFKTLLLVGTGSIIERVQEELDAAPWSGLRVQAVVAADGLAAWMETPGQRPPEEVWLCLSLGDKAGIEIALRALRHSTANIRLVPDWFALNLLNHGISEVIGIPMLDLSASPMTGSTRVIKALEDGIGAALILLLIAPLLLVIALAVKLTSRGPVLFKQLRHGWNGQPIWVYKFRSMVVHQQTDLAVPQATRNDPRITPLGAFLRRTSLDELPQFINVLQGRMSIVGPRPHAVQHNVHFKELVPGYMLRHKVKPGITGWAQINGLRGETDTLDKMKKRVEYDLYYIEHLSLWLDLKIIFATMFRGWVNKNAY